MCKHIVLLALFSVVLLLTQSCTISTRVDYVDNEGRVPRSTIDKIRRAKVTQAWVLRHLGRPEQREMITGFQREIMTYRFVRESIQSGHLLWLLRASGAETETRFFHVLTVAGKVEKAWFDRHARPLLATQSTPTTAIPEHEGNAPLTAAKPSAQTTWRMPKFSTTPSSSATHSQPVPEDPASSVRTETFESREQNQPVSSSSP